MILRWVCWNAFGLWFWYHGIEFVNPLQCMEPQVFFFTVLGAYGNVRTFFKVLFTLLGITSGFTVLLLPIQIWQMGIKNLFRVEKRESRMNVASEWEEAMQGSGRRMRLLFEVGFAVYGVGFAGLAVAAVLVGIELGIKWNHLDGLGSVSTTGQIVPLTVGCFSMFRALALVILGCFGFESTE
jgi:hypothetical protein